MVPWGDKAVSPCVFTPGTADASGMSLSVGLKLSDGRLGKVAATYAYFRLVVTQPSASQETWIQQIEIFDTSGRFTPLNLTGYAGSGFTISASDEYSSYYAWKAFDETTGTMWGSTVKATGRWLKIACPSAKSPVKFAVISDIWGGSDTPKGFRLEGSETGAFSGEEVTLKSVSDLSWGASERKEFLL